MNAKTEAKLARIIALYQNGARKQAKQLLLSLTRVQLAQLLVEGGRVDGYCWGVQWEREFQRWVMMAFEGVE